MSHSLVFSHNYTQQILLSSSLLKISITLHTSSMGDGTKVNTIIIMDTLCRL